MGCIVLWAARVVQSLPIHANLQMWAHSCKLMGLERPHHLQGDMLSARLHFFFSTEETYKSSFQHNLSEKSTASLPVVGECLSAMLRRAYLLQRSSGL